MRVTRNWLEKFLPGLAAVDGLPGLLTDIGIEVEACGRAAPALAGVTVGRIHKTRRLPGTQARACLVDIGTGTDVEVVCGAPNAKRGLRAPLALPGTQLPGGVVVHAERHGVQSAGMLCSAAELGLGGEDARLFELGRKARLGMPLDELVETADLVLELSITPNRGDWLSMLGVARELAAKLGRKSKAPRAPKLKEPLAAQVATIAPDASAHCPKFTCLPVNGIDAAVPTPPLILERLRRCGVRPVTVIVDITNYVMLELGQPLHAFDRGKLSGDITVRWPRAGEQLQLLDGTTAKLTDRMLVVADATGPQAIAGVMGGLNSGVISTTTDILLEAAHFVPGVVRGRTRELNITSEAAFRFERGVDPTMCETAIKRTAALVLKHCGGSCGKLNVIGATPPPPAMVMLPDGRVERLTGMVINHTEARQRLRALGFAVTRQRGKLGVTAPPWRFDVEQAEDLIEEVIRLGGYANLPTTVPALTGSFAPAPETLLSATTARDRLVADGYNEIITYAFVRPQWEADFYANSQPIQLTNPLATELSVMRSGLLCSLVDRAIHNQNRNQSNLRLFELGRCFPPSGTTQPQRLAALCWGPVAADHWLPVNRDHGYHDLAGTLQRLLPGTRLDYQPLHDHPSLHPGRAASVFLDGTTIGIIGELHPALLGKQRYDLCPAPVVFELDFDFLATLPHTPQVRQLSRFPLVRRDLAVVVPADVRVGELVESARGLVHTNGVVVVDVFIFDDFTGKGIAAGKRSVGLRIVMQGKEDNLVDTQINAVMKSVTERLHSSFAAEVRS